VVKGDLTIQFVPQALTLRIPAKLNTQIGPS
jgi:hypothetical protein